MLCPRDLLDGIVAIVEFLKFMSTTEKQQASCHDIPSVTEIMFNVHSFHLPCETCHKAYYVFCSHIYQVIAASKLHNVDATP